MLKYYDVAVVFGGVSNEHEVSVITGTMTCNVLLKAGKSVLPVYITRGGDMLAGENLADICAYKGGNVPKALSACIKNGGAAFFGKKGKYAGCAQIGCALNCCHGGAAEGGAVAGLFSINNIPFASAGLFESAAFMDKYYTKLVLQSLGVKTARYRYARDKKEAEEGAEELGYPVVVKPCKLGSSIGIEKAGDRQKLESALDTAFALDDGVIIEEFLSPRREFNCAAYFAGGKIGTSKIEEVFTGGELLSYDDKYSGGGRRVFPADISEETAAFMRSQTAEVYKALGMRGIVRFDYIMRGGEIFLSEINTVPGSLSQYLISGGYGQFGRVLLSLITQAKADYAAAGGKLRISTGILDNLTPNACKLK